MPFNSQMDITIIKVYTEVGKQLMNYIFRSKDIKPKKRLAYELIERQQMYIKDVWTSIEELVQWREEQVADSKSRDKEKEEE